MEHDLGSQVLVEAFRQARTQREEARPLGGEHESADKGPHAEAEPERIGNAVLVPQRSDSAVDVFSTTVREREALGYNLTDDNAVRVNTGVRAAVEDADGECEGPMGNVVPVDGALLCQAFMRNKGKLG